MILPFRHQMDIKYTLPDIRSNYFAVCSLWYIGTEVIGQQRLKGVSVLLPSRTVPDVPRLKQQLVLLDVFESPVVQFKTAVSVFWRTRFNSVTARGYAISSLKGNLSKRNFICLISHTRSCNSPTPRINVNSAPTTKLSEAGKVHFLCPRTIMRLWMKAPIWGISELFCFFFLFFF